MQEAQAGECEVSGVKAALLHEATLLLRRGPLPRTTLLQRGRTLGRMHVPLGHVRGVARLAPRRRELQYFVVKSA